MIVEVVTDFEITFTCYLFKNACQNNDLVFLVSIPQQRKKNGYGSIENSGELSRAILALLFINTKARKHWRQSNHLFQSAKCKE